MRISVQRLPSGLRRHVNELPMRERLGTFRKIERQQHARYNLTCSGLTYNATLVGQSITYTGGSSRFPCLCSQRWLFALSLPLLSKVALRAFLASALNCRSISISS